MEQITDVAQIEEYYNHFPLMDYFDFDVFPFTKILQFEPDELILQEGASPDYLFV